MEEEFYATIKLKNGEEIFSKVVCIEEKDKIILLVNNPIVLSKVRNKSGTEGYKLEPWLKTTTEDLFVIDMNDVLTMTETKDAEIITMHEYYIKKIETVKSSDMKFKIGDNKVSRQMGYVTNINEAKNILEHIFRNS